MKTIYLLSNRHNFLAYSVLFLMMLFSLLISRVGFSAFNQEKTNKISLKEKKVNKQTARKRLKSVLAKKLSSEFANAKQDTFNEDMKEIVNKVSYPIADTGRIGFVVKNRQQVGLSLKF